MDNGSPEHGSQQFGYQSQGAAAGPEPNGGPQVVQPNHSLGSSEAPQSFQPTEPASVTAPEPPQPPAEPEQPSWAQPPQPPMDPAPPSDPPSAVSDDGTLAPVPVLQVLSPRGIEYAFMTITLFISAIGLTTVLLELVNGAAGFEALSFPVAMLVVSVPLFAWLFLRLKKAELADPALRRDVSKRRNTQFIQIATFLVCIFTLIGVITAVFAKLGGAYEGSIGKTLLNGLVLLVVAGGILAYYWFDEHRSK